MILWLWACAGAPAMTLDQGLDRIDALGESGTLTASRVQELFGVRFGGDVPSKGRTAKASSPWSEVRIQERTKLPGTFVHFGIEKKLCWTVPQARERYGVVFADVQHDWSGHNWVAQPGPHHVYLETDPATRCVRSISVNIPPNQP